MEYAAGNCTEQRHKDASGQLIYQQRYLYDELGRLSRMLGANGESTRYQYDASGNLTHTEDANANPWQNQYDHLNRLTTAYDPTLNDVQFGYDKRGNLTQVTDQRGLVTQYQYNDLDQVTQITSPDTGTQTLSYDKAGNLASSTDANGQQVNYQYDALNRLTQVQYVGHSQYNIQYQYDQHQLDTAANDSDYNAGIGRLTQIDDASGTTRLRYDDQGNIHTRIEQRNGGPQLATGFDYDEAGNLTAIQYPDGSTLTYQRNHLAQINAITYRYDNNGTIETITLADNIQYQGFGQLTALTYGNGLQLNRQYDLNGRLSEYSYGNLQQTFLSYDAVSNITQQSHSGTQAPESRDYEYDAVNRLITELATDGSRGFEYDEVGNRLIKTVAEGEQTPETDDYSYADTSNRLQAVDSQAYQYDSNGNLLARGNQSWTYNARNRMATYSENGVQQAAYTYNAQGERVKKTLADGSTVHYQYNGMGQLMAEYRYQNGSQTQSKQYVWLGMMPVAVVVADGDSNKSVYYLHSDHLATARLATDEQQGVVWQWESSAFGEGLPVENGLSLNLRFPGQYYDAESGLNYNYFRDYDAGLGRYVQSDPIGLNGGINTYGYVGAAPTQAFDAYGLTADCPQSAPYNTSGWVPYGDSEAFHCGYEGFLEDRVPTPDDPIAECFYDENGCLVDEDHEYAQCGGTSNQYRVDEGWFLSGDLDQYIDAYNHTVNDSGGIREKGWDARQETLRKRRDDKRKSGCRLTRRGWRC